MPKSIEFVTTDGPDSKLGPQHKKIPEGHVIYGIEYSGCKGGKLVVRLSATGDTDEIKDGCFVDAWWRVEAPGLPTRHIRLIMGLKSVKRLVSRYGLLDNQGCMNVRDGCYSVDEIANVKAILAENKGIVPIPPDVQQLTGIPQRQENSGICWFTSLCWCMFFNPSMRAHLISKFPAKLKQLAEKCLSDPDAAEKMREILWHEYQFGDEIGQAPELDGQNGVTQFMILAGKFDIPVIRFFVDKDAVCHLIEDPVEDQEGTIVPIRENAEPNEPHIMIFRFRRGNHTDKRLRPARRIRYRGRKYRLTGLMLGSEHCGHQTSAAARDDSWRHWAMTDSDARRYGICATHWSVDTEKADYESWWRFWRFVIPVTNFHGGVCDLAPHNRPLGELETAQASYRGVAESETAGLLNVDYMYLSK